MTGDDLREKYIRFFEERDHLRIPSASLIPYGDPTLLLTNSGMAQFKDYFAGKRKPPHPRVTTVQRCFRTTDIEEVGDDTHLTLFEMLGNFSFGDYFKDEACEWAFRFMTEVIGFPVERLYITVHTSDDEAEKIWLRIGVPKERIYRFGDSDNWWGPAGAEGPCGPCSELHLFMGDAVPENPDRTAWGPNIHQDFVELYNLVFTQFYRGVDGEDTPLPKRNIDTGMGLERTLAALHGKRSAYSEGPLSEIFTRLKASSGIDETPNEKQMKALRVLTDHGRAATFLIGDGVALGNTGRGYVLRRLIRRAMLLGKQAELPEDSLATVASITSEVMGDSYPELRSNLPFVLRMLDTEQEAFSKVLDFGTSALEGISHFREVLAHKLDLIESDLAGFCENLAGKSATEKPIAELISLVGIQRPHGKDARSVGANAAYDAFVKTVSHVVLSDQCNADKLIESCKSMISVISGEEAFLLYDAYGFPVEIIRECLKDYGLAGIDEAGFENAMKIQSEGSRLAGASFSKTPDSVYTDVQVSDTRFTGYETTESAGKVLYLVKDGERVASAKTGEAVEVVLDVTPFYAERGGQVGDTGLLLTDFVRVHVADTRGTVGHVSVHFAKIVSGELSEGDVVTAIVDKARRERIRRNHTATHLLHSALREVLGRHVKQSGSVVHPDYLRFDFTHFSALTPEEIKQIQDKVDEKILENLPVEVMYTTLGEALKNGALAFFGDTYENKVRTIRIDGDWSYELCGGTHMDMTGGIGSFIITSETGIGTGVRRIFALTGVGANEATWQRFSTVDTMVRLLNATPENVHGKVSELLEELARSKRTINNLEENLLRATVSGNGSKKIKSVVVDTDGGTFEARIFRVPASRIESLRRAGDHTKTQIERGVAVIGGIISDKPVVLIMATDNVAGTMVNCGAIAKKIAETLGGGGGGQASIAQAGGKDPNLLDAALEHAESIFQAMKV